MYSVLMSGERYLTDDIKAELMIMRCGGVVSIVPGSAAVGMAGANLLDLGDGRGMIPAPPAMMDN